MSDLDDILKGESAPAPEPVAEPVAPEPVATEPVVESPDKPNETESKVAVAAEEEPPDWPHVPKSAMHAMRSERNDWKDKYARADTEVALLKRQLEEAKKAVATPAPVAEAQNQPTTRRIDLPNPVEDPAGYMRAVQDQQFNAKLDISESMLRDKIDNDADVDEKIAAFKAAAQANPTLGAQLARERHPYAWAYKEGQKLLAMREVGDDPTAYRTKIEAEIRAKIAAEMATSEPAAVSPGRAPLNLPKSLANVASSGPRATAAWNGPPSLEDILKK